MTTLDQNTSWKAVIVTVFPVLFVVSGDPLQAGVYDSFQTRPGTQITNRANLSFTVLGVPQDIRASEATFTVSPIPTSGSLVAYEWYRGAGGTKMSFPSSEFAADVPGKTSFQSQSAPVNTATRGANKGLTAPAPGTLPVRSVDRIHPGQTVFLGLDDVGLNLDSNAAETLVLTITDDITGDVEVLRLHETGLDTGFFTGWIETQSATVVSGDGVLSVAPRSVLTASYENQFAFTATMKVDVTVGPVDPYGVIFDSTTGAPVSGVEVTIIDIATGLPARVYGDDLHAVYPPTVITGGEVTDSSGATYNLAPGEFRFPYVDLGQYQFIISDTDGYSFPTARDDVDLQALPGAPWELLAGSRLEVFDVVAGPPIRIDVPADRKDIAYVKRTADRSDVEIGDFVQYTVEITPSLDGAIDIRDTLPRGIDFIKGSLKINGTPAGMLFDAHGNPVAVALDKDGRHFLIDDFPVTSGQAIIITYVAQVGLGAKDEDIIPTRTDVTGQRLRKAYDTHEMEIEAPFDLDTTAIIGDITAGGCDGTPPEMDLSGIRVFLETGEYAITDKDGRFSFRDIPHRDHVVLLDELTLPLGARPVLCHNTTRRAGSAISQFVDTQPGMMARAEFYIAFDVEPAALNAPEFNRLPSLSEISDLVGEMNSGVPVGTGETPFTKDAGARLRYDQEWLDTLPVNTPQGLLSPKDGELPSRASIRVEFLRRDTYSAELLVNGEKVPGIFRDRGLKSATSDLNLDVWQGIQINEGRNTVELILRKGAEEVYRETREVLYATGFTKAQVVLDSSSLSSDGKTAPHVRLHLTNSQGIPLRPGTKVNASVNSPFTFEPEGGRRRSMDASEKAPSSATSLTVGQNGMVDIHLSPVIVPGTAVISLPQAETEIPIHIKTPDRPWVFVGIAEGSLAEAQVMRHMRKSGDFGGDDDIYRGRTAFFAEGVIKGEWLTTIRYDSAKGQDEGFYQIDPDKDYVVYGDASYQANAAESRFPLYIRMRSEEAEFLIGDFSAKLQSSLVSFSREVTGLRAEFEAGPFRLMGFAAEAGQKFFEDKIPMNGTPGPFSLSEGEMNRGSETVSLLTVSRRDTTEVLGEERLEPGVDYVLDHKRGRIFLRRPVPAFNGSLDRNVLQVSYETSEEIVDGRILGGRAEVDLAEDVTAGVTALDLDNVDGSGVDIELTGLDVTYRFSDALTLSAEGIEVSKTRGTLTRVGQAQEVRLTWSEEEAYFTGYAKRFRGSADLSSKIGADDLDIVSIEGSRALSFDETLHLEASGQTEENHTQGETRNDVSLEFVKDFGALGIGAGFGYASVNGARDGESIKMLSQLTWTGFDGRFSVESEASKALQTMGDGVTSDELTFEARYQLNDRIALFAGTQLAFDPAANELQSAKRAGLEFAPWEGGRITAGLIDADVLGQASQAAFVGARQTFDIAEGTILSFSLDGQEDLGSSETPAGSSLGEPYIAEAFLSGTAGIRRTTDSWSAGFEMSHFKTDGQNSQSFRLSADGEVSPAWSLGGEAFYGTMIEDSVFSEELKLRFGAAHRAGDRAPITIYQLEGDITGEDFSRLYASIDHHRYLDEKSSLGLRAAVKWNQRSLGGADYDDYMSFLGTEYRYDLTESFDIGLHAAHMSADRSGQSVFGYGASIGLTPFENGQINIGYNIEGFRDPDFAKNNNTDKGYYIEFKMKVDQNSFRKLFR